MSSVYEGITVLVVIFEMAAFMSLFWRSVDREPHRRWPRLQAPLRMLPGVRVASNSRVRLDPVDARPAWAYNNGGKTPLASLPSRGAYGRSMVFAYLEFDGAGRARYGV